MGWGSMLFRFATTVVGAGLGFIAGGPPGAAIGAGIGSGYGALHEGASLGEAAISAGTAAVGGYYGGQAFSDWWSPVVGGSVGPGATEFGGMVAGEVGAAEFGSMVGPAVGSAATASTTLGTFAKYAVGAIALKTLLESQFTSLSEGLPPGSWYTENAPTPTPAPEPILPPTPPTGELTPIAPEMESRTEELPARLREPTTEDIDIMNARERERQAAFNEQRASEELKKIQLLGARDINLSPATRESEPTTALERLYGIQKTPGRAIHAYP